MTAHDCVCPMCGAPSVPDEWRLIAFPPSAFNNPWVDPWDAADIVTYAEQEGLDIASYGTPLPQLLAEAEGRLGEFLAAAACAGHGCFTIGGITLLLQASCRLRISEARAAEIEGVVGDAINHLICADLRQLVVEVEMIIVDMERRLANLHNRNPDGKRVDEHFLERWRRQGFAALARAAAAEVRAESAAHDNAQEFAEWAWYQGARSPSEQRKFMI